MSTDEFNSFEPVVRTRNLSQDLRDIWHLTRRHGTFSFPVLETGLFPAAYVAGSEREYTNYQLVWVRDNIHVAHQLAVVGDVSGATNTVGALTSYFTKYRKRFLDILEGRVDAASEINRPHVRFDGANLSEVSTPTGWKHKQNDALGYYVWLFSKLALSESFFPTEQQLETLSLFPHFFARIEYWQDEDSGHWEEWPKIEASSIGVVVAALRMMRAVTDVPTMRRQLRRNGIGSNFLDGLIQHGEQALAAILPNECVQENEHRRDVDSALLFLIYPLELLEGNVAEDVLENVISQLQGEIGIARYPFDDFWAPEYRVEVRENERTVPVTSDHKRGRIEVKRGQEAQWCIFDSIISCIYAKRYLAFDTQRDLEQQLFYLNRSLRQLTPEHCRLGSYRCPEAYFIENGKWVPNDATPLLWAQANLRLAMHFAERSADRLSDR